MDKIARASLLLGIIGETIFAYVALGFSINEEVFAGVAMLAGLAAGILASYILKRAKPQPLEGRSCELAKVGLICGVMAFLGGLFILGVMSGFPVLSDSPIPLNRVQASPKAKRNACINNLRQLDGAKEQWGVEHGKTSTSDIPSVTDLVGPGKYLRELPVCMEKGTYSLGNLGTKPRCSVGGHTLDN